jgi:hypothetical protein
MLTIDADAHVMEGPRTWEYGDPSERKFMAVLVDRGDNSDRQFWLVDGKIRGHVRHVIKPKDFEAHTERVQNVQAVQIVQIVGTGRCARNYFAGGNMTLDYWMLSRPEIKSAEH